MIDCCLCVTPGWLNDVVCLKLSVGESLTKSVTQSLHKAVSVLIYAGFLAKSFSTGMVISL